MLHKSSYLIHDREERKSRAEQSRAEQGGQLDATYKSKINGIVL
jgi:hypothetical protein